MPATPKSLPYMQPPVSIKAHISPSDYEVLAIGALDDPKARAFVGVLSFFVYQAKQQGRYHEFLAWVFGRFFAAFPQSYVKGLPAGVAMVKEKIKSQFKGCYFHQRQSVPQIHWENFLSLNIDDMFKIGEIIKEQAKAKRAIAFRKTPTIRKEAGEIVQMLTRRRIQHAATEFPIDDQDPEGELNVVDVTQELEETPGEGDRDFIEVVYNIGSDNDDLDDPDYVDDGDVDEDDM